MVVERSSIPTLDEIALLLCPKAEVEALAREKLDELDRAIEDLRVARGIVARRSRAGARTSSVVTGRRH